MKKRTVLGALAGAATAMMFARMSMKMTRDLRRYDHLRSLSNEGPVMQETPEMMMQVLTYERHFLKNLKSFFQALPKDIARYMKIESM